MSGLTGYPSGYRVYPIPAKSKIVIPDPAPLPDSIGYRVPVTRRVSGRVREYPLPATRFDTPSANIEPSGGWSRPFVETVR